MEFELILAQTGNRIKLIPAQTGKGTMKMYKNWFYNFQLIADLRRGRTCKSFSSTATQYALLCVFCVCVCSLFLIWNISIFEYLEYSRKFKDREISYQKQRTDKQQTNTQMYILHLRRSVINWQRWEEVRTHVDNSISCCAYLSHFIIRKKRLLDYSLNEILINRI